jgi:hypothetical protein
MILYALCDVFCVFLLCRESPDMILGDKHLISEVVLSQSQSRGRTIQLKVMFT